MKHSKRYRTSIESAQKAGLVSIEEAVDIIKGFPPAKFDETIEAHLKLGINPKKSEQHVRGSVELPHGTGKTPVVAVFAVGEKAKEAKDAKADLVLDVDDIEKIKKGEKISFDVAVATPDMMPKLAVVAKILGPKGLMPSPKTETVTPNIERAVNLLKRGRANYKNDGGGCIHQAIGKLSFAKEKIVDNFKTFVESVEKQKPPKLKGKLVKSITISATMSPGIKVK